jgi:hypothetical protein
MTELADIMDEYVDDLPTCRSLRSEIERTMGAFGVSTRCDCGCARPNGGLNRVCYRIFDLCQGPADIEEDGADDENRDEDEEGRSFLKCAQQQWSHALWHIRADWMQLFDETYPIAHPAIRGGFFRDLQAMLFNDFMHDLRYAVETQIARHERRAMTGDQLELFPE